MSRRPARTTSANEPVATSEASCDSPRKAILVEAARLFSYYGYAGTTMADIADAVGVRSPSLYYHFANKAEILEAIADLPMDVALAGSEEMLSATDLSPPVRFYLLVRNIVYYLCQSEYELNCMFDAAFNDERFETFNKKLIVWLKNIEKLINIGVAENAFSQQDARVSTYIVRGLMEAAIRVRGGYSHISSKDTAENVARFAVKGLLADDYDVAELFQELGTHKLA